MTVRCPSNGRSASSTSGLLAPAAKSSAGRAACSCLSWPAVLPRRPHLPLLLPPLARPTLHSNHPHPLLFCGDGSAAKLVNPHTPLRVGIHCRVFPFLGLGVIHRRGAVGMAWSMWSTTEFHRKNTVRREADSWVHGSRKEVPPYYTENNYSSTSQQGPTRRATVFREKTFPP